MYGRREFSFLRQVEAFFKKNETFVDDVVCTEAAIQSFKKAEERCKETNDTFDFLFRDPDHLGPEFAVRMKRMKRYLCNVLGEEQEYKKFLEELPYTLRITSGATASTSRRMSHPYQKLGRYVSCTKNAMPYLRFCRDHHGYELPKFSILEENRIEFVRKNYKTHRTIACEPAGNVPLQLAFDTYAKKRLRRNGVDLSSQFINQELARMGSIDGSISTVDLEAASDTIAYNVVSYLFPKVWRGFLCDIRTPRYSHPELGSGRYEKFSSMGNGSTFVIETLLFCAACYAVEADKFNVYGDDIAVDTEHTGPLVQLLAQLGFTLNKEKTFLTGPFRESCGTDWWEGVNITPFYLRSEDLRLTTISHNINGIAALGWWDSSLWEYLRTHVEQKRLISVPFNENTQSGIHIPAHHAYAKKLILQNRPRRLNGNEKPLVVNYGPVFRAYRFCRKADSFPRDSVALFLWFAGRRNTLEWDETQLVAPDPLDLTHDKAMSTLATVQHLKYRVGLLMYQPPQVGTPDHLYPWSDWLSRKDLTPHCCHVGDS